MSQKLYDGAMRILKALVVEYRKEDMTDADIVDGLDFAKRIIGRLPILTKNARESLSVALDDTKEELEGKNK